MILTTWREFRDTARSRGPSRAEIRAGQWTPGNAVPSRNQLAERFGIARETAARAHAWLARAGYLVAVPGVGMVVTPVTRWPEGSSN
jgi:DNA-binding GntR family transcriptional regulator